MIFSKVQLNSHGAWLEHPQAATEDRALPIRSRLIHKLLGCNIASLALRPCDVKELSLAKVHGTKVLSRVFVSFASTLSAVGQCLTVIVRKHLKIVSGIGSDY
jgi:hypothetical protein